MCVNIRRSITIDYTENRTRINRTNFVLFLFIGEHPAAMQHGGSCGVTPTILLASITLVIANLLRWADVSWIRWKKSESQCAIDYYHRDNRSSTSNSFKMEIVRLLSVVVTLVWVLVGSLSQCVTCYTYIVLRSVYSGSDNWRIQAVRTKCAMRRCFCVKNAVTCGRRFLARMFLT